MYLSTTRSAALAMGRAHELHCTASQSLRDAIRSPKTVIGHARTREISSHTPRGRIGRHVILCFVFTTQLLNVVFM